MSDTVVLQDMFMINTSPLSTQQYDGLCTVVLSHFSMGSTEVHIVFDKPGGLLGSRKSFERRRRDDVAIST